VPEDFGILATINMIITFVELLTDSGFAKYIIQCDFKNKRDENEYIQVAFWTNLILSIVIWIIILIFKFPIAKLVGNVGYENVIVIAALQVIVAAFSSIQMAIYRRYFNFKTLFIARILTSVIPLCVTVPLALILKNYWSLVIGAIVVQLVNAAFLTIKSSWKPKIYYSFLKLKKMFSFSVWSLAEALAYWVTTWFDVFIIGAAFSAYLLGLYKNSLNMVNSLTLLVKSSIIPVLFSSLSRLKYKQDRFEEVYYDLQFCGAAILIPMGIGIFVFRDLATTILFGSGWSEAANIIGVWGLSACVMATFVNFNAEVYKAKGIPKILFVYEIVCLAIMIPCCVYAKNFGFWPLVYTRAAVVVIQFALGLLFMRKFANFKIGTMIKNALPPIVCAIIMGICGELLKFVFTGIGGQLVAIVICILVYFLLMRIGYKKRIVEAIEVIRNKDTDISEELND
jgi:O-antigen/teichoic acid export membrane protein